jgi:hypothetical protein
VGLREPNVVRIAARDQVTADSAGPRLCDPLARSNSHPMGR